MLKKAGLLFLALILLAAGFVFRIFWTTGFFRQVENQFDGQIARSIPLAGVEDMAISYEDQFLLLSADDRAARRDGQPRQGGLYRIDLARDPFQPQLLSGDFAGTFYPHGISMIRLDSAFYKVYAINHVPLAGRDDVTDHTNKEHTIEVFHLRGDSLIHLETLTDPLLKSPNDLVALDADRFYFTNDHGADSPLGVLAENYLGRALANVVYYDGSTYRETAGGIAYANGINYDRRRDLLFVASPRHFLVKVYRVQENGDLAFLESIDCGTGVDNIELDQNGFLWIGCHPNLLRFSAYALGKKETAPSELITIDYRSVGDYEVKSIFTNDGSDMSAASVAVPYGDYIYAGNVMDGRFLVLQR